MISIQIMSPIMNLNLRQFRRTMTITLSLLTHIADLLSLMKPIHNHNHRQLGREAATVMLQRGHLNLSPTTLATMMAMTTLTTLVLGQIGTIRDLTDWDITFVVIAFNVEDANCVAMCYACVDQCIFLRLHQGIRVTINDKEDIIVMHVGLWGCVICVEIHYEIIDPIMNSLIDQLCIAMTFFL